MSAVSEQVVAEQQTRFRYFATRFSQDARREVVWRTLVRHFFQPLIPRDGCVLELGAGYGHFINNVIARRRIALDVWPEFVRHLDRAVEAHIADATDLTFLEPGSVDFVFASNLFEHLPQDALAIVLARLRTILRPGGTITFLQPNYRYAFREYFDDYTHTTVYSHVSLCDFLEANGYRILLSKPRFLPFSVKSSRIVSSALISLYLRSPWKPGAKQMLVQAAPFGPSDCGR